MKVALRRLELASVARFGCWLGMVAAFLPSLFCGLTGVGLARLLYRWLLNWRALELSLLGREFGSLDLVETLGLTRLLEALQVVALASFPLSILMVAVLALAGGAALAAIGFLAGLAYNLLARFSGGLVVELEAVSHLPGVADPRDPEL